MDDYEFIRTERRGAVLIVRFFNPPRTLMNAQMVRELNDLLDKAAADDEIRSLVFTGGAPGFFIQHYSVTELVETAKAAREDPEIGAGDELHATHQAFLKMEMMPKPIVVAINGIATGGGFEFCLACDIRLMAIGARVGLPEVTIGILPGAGGTQRLARAVGLPRAKELIMRGRVIDAHEAERIGMVHRAVDPKRLMGEAVALAEELAARPQKSIGRIKQTLREGIEMPLMMALKLEQDAFWELMRTDEALELMEAYSKAGERGL